MAWTHPRGRSAGPGVVPGAVDFTLTNQDSGDFHGQNLANTSFAGAVGRRADHEANLRRILTQAPSPKPTSGVPISPMP